MYWAMSKYKIARQKAKEILEMLDYNPDVMIRTNDIIKAVEQVKNIDVQFSKFDFSKIRDSKGKTNAFADYGAMMCVSMNDQKRCASILLNEKETPEMVRFSLVHELGHLMTSTLDSFDGYQISTHIDMDITSIPEELLSGEKYPFLVKEQIANIFALLVLIPYDSLIKAISKYDSIDEVAKFFGVEKSAVISRLRLAEE